MKVIKAKRYSDIPEVAALRTGSEFRGALMARIFEVGCEMIGEEEITKLMKEAIHRNAVLRAETAKSQISEEGYVKDFFDAPAIGWSIGSTGMKCSDSDILELTEDMGYMQYHYCPILHKWQTMGYDQETCEKLCDIAMQGDRTMAAVMGYDFELKETLAAGDDYCDIRYIRKK